MVTKKKPSPPKPSNVEAFERLVTPDLEQRLPALVAYGRSLAEAVDNDQRAYCPECKRSGANAALWKEYRQTLEAVAATTEQKDDGQATLLQLVRTPVRNSKNTRTRNAGTGNRRSSGGSG